MEMGRGKQRVQAEATMAHRIGAAPALALLLTCRVPVAQCWRRPVTQSSLSATPSSRLRTAQLEHIAPQIASVRHGSQPLPPQPYDATTPCTYQNALQSLHRYHSTPSASAHCAGIAHVGLANTNTALQPRGSAITGPVTSPARAARLPPSPFSPPPPSWLPRRLPCHHRTRASPSCTTSCARCGARPGPRTAS